jgi:signal transduction histidine kinase
MNWGNPSWWPLGRRRGRFAQGPEATLFQGLRNRLTLWYCLVLCAALVAFSVILYLGARYFLFNPVQGNTSNQAQYHAVSWLTDSPDRACSSFGSPDRFGPPPPNQGSPLFELVACFDQNGNLLQNNTTGQLPSVFLSNTVAKRALLAGWADDTVNAGGMVGLIYRYAQAVPNPSGNGYIGVVVIGEPIQAQQDALSLIFILLLSIGGLTLLGAGLGGLFLANRALEPARLAWRNQQRFIGDAAHELRTPLTLLRADAEVLLRSREHLESEDAELLEDIVTETDRMSTLATSMLTLARLDANSTHREHEVVNLNDTALAGVRRVQAFADQSEISLRAESQDGVQVIGDPMLLEQAVLVLLDNAIKYNRRGGSVTIRTEVKDADALLEVSDTGIGIAAEHLPHLGERFYRVDKSRSREAGGSGLGLSIARGIAVAHGGTLTLTSMPDQGTTVTIKLPLAQGDRTQREVDAEEVDEEVDRAEESRTKESRTSARDGQ